MRHIFIINPAAGRIDSSQKLHKEIIEACEKHDITPLIFISEYEGYEREMTKKMCSLFSNEEIRFYSCGGSGTLTQILSGITDFNNVEVACYPCGQTNDLLKCYGPDTNSFRSIENLITGRTDMLDIIDMNGFRSIDFVCFGLGNNFFENGIALSLASKFHPKISYSVNTIKDIIKNNDDEYELIIDGKNYSGHYCYVVAFNGNCMGGNVIPLPNSRPNDGTLDVLLIKSMSRLSELKFFHNFTNSRLDKTNSHCYIMKAKSLSVTWKNEKKSLAFNCDGEYYNPERTTTSIQLLESKLKFIVPEDAYILPIKKEED